MIKIGFFIRKSERINKKLFLDSKGPSSALQKKNISCENINQRENGIYFSEFFGKNSSTLQNYRQNKKMIAFAKTFVTILMDKDFILNGYFTKNELTVEYRTYLDRSDFDKDLQF